MTEEQIQHQIELIEKMGREACKSPETARKFIEDLEERVGFPFNEDRVVEFEERMKKKNNA